jgi:hypothetical protein
MTNEEEKSSSNLSFDQQEQDFMCHFLTSQADDAQEEENNSMEIMHSSAPSILQRITAKVSHGQDDEGDEIEHHRSLYKVVSNPQTDVEEAKKEDEDDDKGEEFDLQYRFDIKYEIEYESEIKQRISNRRPTINCMFGLESPLLLSPDFDDNLKSTSAKSFRERMQSLVGAVSPPQLEKKRPTDFKIDLIQ